MGGGDVAINIRGGGNVAESRHSTPHFQHSRGGGDGDGLDMAFGDGGEVRINSLGVDGATEVPLV